LANANCEKTREEKGKTSGELDVDKKRTADRGAFYKHMITTATNKHPKLQYTNLT
jgi:hypothetical protein